jgi:8-oxo-dGTP pyrophosphatase MutT (NUDIX family)
VKSAGQRRGSSCYVRAVSVDITSTVRAACVLIVRDRLVLAVSRKHDHSVFGLPAGSIEPGETAKAAAARELQEETGLVVSESDLVLIHEGPVNDGDDRGVVSTFWAPDPGGEPRTSEEGAVGWVDWETLARGPYAAYNAKVRAAAGL